MSDGMVASGFPCPHCSRAQRQIILSITGTQMRLLCSVCEHVWNVDAGEVETVHPRPEEPA